MSTHFDLYCSTHEEWGPEIRRSGMVSLRVRTENGFSGGEVAQAAWAHFLDEHEFCDLRLRREGHRPVSGHR